MPRRTEPHRTQTLRCRCTPGEKDRILQRAEEAGWQPGTRFGRWLRDRLLGELTPAELAAQEDRRRAWQHRDRQTDRLLRELEAWRAYGRQQGLERPPAPAAAASDDPPERSLFAALRPGCR